MDAMPYEPTDSDDECLHVDHACIMRFQCTSSNNSRWILHSRASNHYIASKSYFVFYRPIPKQPIETASGTIYGEGIGDVELVLTYGSICITDVIHVPAMIANTNLLSVGQLEAKGMTFTIKDST